MNDRSDEQPPIGENTNERMADRPPVGSADLDATTTAVDDTATDAGGILPIDDV